MNKEFFEKKQNEQKLYKMDISYLKKWKKTKVNKTRDEKKNVKTDVNKIQEIIYVYLIIFAATGKVKCTETCECFLLSTHERH